MTMIGIDPHKATHTAVAVDDNDVVLDELRAVRALKRRISDRVWRHLVADAHPAAPGPPPRRAQPPSRTPS